MHDLVLGCDGIRRRRGTSDWLQYRNILRNINNNKSNYDDTVQDKFRRLDGIVD